jgi:hypothetical protein
MGLRRITSSMLRSLPSLVGHAALHRYRQVAEAQVRDENSPGRVYACFTDKHRRRLQTISELKRRRLKSGGTSGPSGVRLTKKNPVCVLELSVASGIFDHIAVNNRSPRDSYLMKISELQRCPRLLARILHRWR